MNIRKFFDNLFVRLGALVLIGAIAFVSYGIKTQYPDVAIYMNCSKPK